MISDVEAVLNPHSFEFYRPHESQAVLIAFFNSCVSAGFPSPTEDFFLEDDRIDLVEHLITNPISTFIVRAKGNSMEGARIFDDSLLIVDRSREPGPNAVCLCVINNEFTVKRVQKRGDRIVLVPANPKFREIEVTPEMDFYVWGVITKVINDPAR